MHTDSNPHPQYINRYKILKRIGKGGMGEVFLAYDPLCQREIALKQIRSDLVHHPQIKGRFLSEARITCQLTHPSIIPIYTIQEDDQSAYYTMPFVEGDTLKQIIRKASIQDKQGDKLDHLAGSIPALMRIFLSICQALAYAHSKRVIHRDLKLENIIIGKYGEVLILDWGLAKSLDVFSEYEASNEEPLVEPAQSPYMTRIGKIVGTVAYMAPEMALGSQATPQTDIYSLGVILYQLLTLRVPFKKESLEEFKKHIQRRFWLDPIVAAPYRDIPRILSRLVDRCLAFHPKDRYLSVDHLINDLEIYTEGRSEWFPVAQLNTNKKSDWEFQENVLIAEHVAITRMTEAAEWFSLMISRHSFTGNTKIETEIALKQKGHGIGFLISVPEIGERSFVTEGYCLWIGSDQYPSTKLLRSNVEVVHAPDIFLKREQSYKIKIEKIDNSIHLYMDNMLQFSYSAHIPLTGTHIGLIARDADFNISPIEVYVGSLNITVNCLAVPDAFLAHGDYPKALNEYRRIAYSFPDRPEGREALFRAGLTFLEQAKKDPAQKTVLLEAALQEFEKLHKTPGGPLEYLGKALVYQVLNAEEEEIKCFELAYRRYPKHPLLPILQEEVVSRMHEVSRLQRTTAYHFILLTISHLPISAIDTHTVRLLGNLQKHWESLPFLEMPPQPDEVFYTDLAIPLAFWLAKPYLLGEIIQQEGDQNKSSTLLMENGLFALLKLGAKEYARHQYETWKHKLELPDFLFKIWESFFHTSLAQSFESLFNPEFPFLDPKILRFAFFLIDSALDQDEAALAYKVIQKIENFDLNPVDRLQLNLSRITVFLLQKKIKEASACFNQYSLAALNSDASLLHFLYGCWLQSTDSKNTAIKHFRGLMPTPYPRSWTLGSHYLAGTLHEQWIERAFLWEKKALYRQLSLFYLCSGDETTAQLYRSLANQQVVHAEP